MDRRQNPMQRGVAGMATRQLPAGQKLRLFSATKHEGSSVCASHLSRCSATHRRHQSERPPNPSRHR
ncbi:hypothetical protein GQ55_5G200200 [Panicum hallii var. hallii]|uniref:Uncharacterized protein n=1 Tax=Panicum hallii var. hallii TaxID=1504633 RepID=A0A2T7DI66_9POAL|nr:hypothetical protein GQ55_5G200200 [Panicum hallii var. hallii]